MNSRLNNRLKALEAKIAPKAVVLVFLGFEGPDRPSRADQLAGSGLKTALPPSDSIHEVWMNLFLTE
jgi:hypothetical protein